MTRPSRAKLKAMADAILKADGFVDAESRAQENAQYRLKWVLREQPKECEEVAARFTRYQTHLATFNWTRAGPGDEAIWRMFSEGHGRDVIARELGETSNHVRVVINEHRRLAKAARD